MACRPTGAKPLSEPTLEYCFNEVTIARQIGHFLSVAAHWPQPDNKPDGHMAEAPYLLPPSNTSCRAQSYNDVTLMSDMMSIALFFQVL